MKTMHSIAVCALVASAALVSGGCSRSRESAADQPLEALASTSSSPQGWSALPQASALLRLPGRQGEAVTVRERRVPQGLTQEITDIGPQGGEQNRLTIAVHGDAARPGLSPGKPSEAGIKAELAAEFPGQRPRIVSEPRRNAYGPYGLAVLAGPDGQRCLYAWQWLDGTDAQVRERLGGSASWRARLCHRKQMLDEMAATLDRIAIGASEDVALVVEKPATRVTTAKPKATTRRAPQPPVEPANAQPQPVSIGGQRYLATIGSQPRLARGEPATALLDPSLPAEAFRGPTRGTPNNFATRSVASSPRASVPLPE